MEIACQEFYVVGRDKKGKHMVTHQFPKDRKQAELTVAMFKDIAINHMKYGVLNTAEFEGIRWYVPRTLNSDDRRKWRDSIRCYTSKNNSI